MKKTFTNNRNNETVTTDLSLTELATKFAQTANEDNWLWFWVTKHVNEASNPTHTEMIAFLGDSFLYAIGMGLKKPMIRLHVANRRYKIYLSGKGTLCFKSGAIHPDTKDPVGDEQYMGCLYNNKFLPNRERNLLTEEQQFLDAMNTNPVEFLSKCGKDMNRCCYCNLPLEDARSKEVGYGAICGARWGLPYGRTYDEKVPSFAQLWGKAGGNEKKNIRYLCQAIKKEPHNADLWGILGDVLEEAGFQKKPQAPAIGVVIPS